MTFTPCDDFEASNKLVGMLAEEALSEESSLIRKADEFFSGYSQQPLSTYKDEFKLKFDELKKEWEMDTAVLSSIADISMHSAYQRIIGMGNVALPMIFSELKKAPGHWFWALKSITGEDPVQPHQRGRIKQMAQVWLLWGKEHGYVD